MDNFNFYQLAIFILEGFFVATLIMVLFRFRFILGIGMLFAALGLFQFMQVFLSSTVYIAITKNIIVSPGSSVLFTATLFAVLLIYIKEDASETRKIIYALVASNIVMSILLKAFSLNIEESSFYNPFNVSTKLFDNNTWVLLVGTITLFVDALLIIIIYEFVSNRITNLFFRILVTMLFVVNFDTICFSLGAFWGFEKLQTILISGIVSKSAAAIFYSTIFTIYLLFFERDENKKSVFMFKDIFQPLTYKQKFEIVKNEKELIIKNTEQAIYLSEIKYNTLTNISPVGVFFARADGYTTYVNPKWCAISGLSQEKALGDGWFSVVHPEDKAIIKENWYKAVSQNTESYAEYRFMRSDGTIKWVLGQAVPQKNQENQTIGYVGTITDITKIKLFELEQNRLKEKAEESDRLKSAFLANISHEIRTPMNGVLGFSELLKQPQLSSEERDEYIKLILESGKRMLNIINDIVDISKIESGQIEVSLSTININELIDYVNDFFISTMNKKGVQFYVTKNFSDKEAIIFSDREKIISILTNLINNAIKFTDKGYIELNCSTRREFIDFFIKDTGIGIPRDKQHIIFERFVQADFRDIRAYQGAGLGLSIAKAFVELLGGIIWFESEEGKGAKFYFTLPSQYAQNEQKSFLKKDIKTFNTDLTRKIKVLVVEDDKLSDLLITTIIKDISHAILHAKNGHEAIETCKNNPDIDLVLMDIKMPTMNGVTAAKYIKELLPKCPIVAQSAYALEHEKKLNSKVFDAYITKPIEKETLLSIIRDQINMIE